MRGAPPQPTHTMITYKCPRMSGDPDAGLAKGTNGTLFAIYYVDGVQKRRSLKTKAILTARIRRTEFHEELQGKGGLATDGRRGSKPVDPDSGTYVYQRKPFFVKIRGKFIGDFETEEEAKAARNAALGLK